MHATRRSPEKRLRDGKFYVTRVLLRNENKKREESGVRGKEEEEPVSRGDASADKRDPFWSRSRPNLLLCDM